MKGNLFINRNFFLLWSGKIISQLGDKFYGIALAWWILKKTDSPAIMGLFMALLILPGLIIGAFAGTFVDRWNRKRILIGADILRGIFVLIVSWLSLVGMMEIWHVLAAAVVISLASAFFEPSVQAVIPQIVNEEQIPRANAMNQMVGGLCTVAGPLLGALAVSIFGFTWVFFANAVSYILSALLEGFMAITSSPDQNVRNNALWQDIKDGFSFIKGRKEVVLIILVIGIAHFFLGSLMVTLPVLARELIGNGVRNLGYMEMMIGVGLIIGAILTGSKKKAVVRELHLFWFIMAFGICFLIVSGIRFVSVYSVIPYMLIMAVIGMTIAGASIFWQSLLQMKTPNNLAGRVFSISTIVGNASLPVAYGIFGVLLEKVALAPLMLFNGIGLMSLSSLMFLWSKDTKEDYKEMI